MKRTLEFILVIIMISVFSYFGSQLEDSVRNAGAGIFILIGFILFRYSDRAGSFFYDRQIEIIKKRSSLGSFVKQARKMGSILLITGALFILTSVFL